MLNAYDAFALAISKVPQSVIDQIWADIRKAAESGRMWCYFTCDPEWYGLAMAYFENQWFHVNDDANTISWYIPQEGKRNG